MTIGTHKATIIMHFIDYDYCKEKNKRLKEERDISFEEIIAALEDGYLLDVIENPNKKYPNQEMYVIDINGYVYLVPFVRKDKDAVFLKTIFRSRKMTRQYLDDEE